MKKNITITLNKKDINKILNQLVVIHSEFDERMRKLLDLIMKLQPKKK